MSPTTPAPHRLRLATWNVNSLRARLPALGRFLHRAAPDILCLQDTKTAGLSPEAQALFDHHGCHIVHTGAGAYNGVAIAARHNLLDVQRCVQFGDSALDREPRIISAVVDLRTPLRAVSVYVPHGRTLDHSHYRFKLAFLDAVTANVTAWLNSNGHLMVAGDINVAPTNSDVFHPDAFVGATERGNERPSDHAAVLADFHDAHASARRARGAGVASEHTPPGPGG